MPNSRPPAKAPIVERVLRAILRQDPRFSERFATWASEVSLEATLSYALGVRSESAFLDAANLINGAVSLISIQMALPSGQRTNLGKLYQNAEVQAVLLAYFHLHSELLDTIRGEIGTEFPFLSRVIQLALADPTMTRTKRLKLFEMALGDRQLAEVALNGSLEVVEKLRAAQRAIQSRLPDTVIVQNFPISDSVDLSGRTKNCLRRLGLNYWTEVARTPRRTLMGSQNFGTASLEEVNYFLGSYGLNHVA